ncbi:MAG: glutamine synthetase [Clostridia bacterium BRH_c25]|nr:MAG: glutamine synthetase [Clostridia bacterium BRH_c25]
MTNLSDLIKNDLIYVIDPGDYQKEELVSLLKNHPEIRFVSIAAADLTGNSTDERIPIKAFFDDIEEFLNGAIQTDGSSVVLPGIATLNNGKVDLVADTNCLWFVDYNYENIDYETSRPVGTLRIPSFLMHNNKYVDSRSILIRAIDRFKASVTELFKKYPAVCSEYGINCSDIEDIVLTSATELEFWVKTPNDMADVEALSASQELQESYWKRTKGVVRTSLEQSLLLMGKYNLNPEMGHKEVGGIKAKLDETGNLTHIMEQLEIDWKYDNALQAADNEKWVRYIVKEVFRKNGLEVTFHAKPIEGVAGNGEHTHIGVAARLKNGKIINLFTPADIKKDFLSPIGYGALMGLLKNYEVINPFISFTIDSLNRLKPGFEAPVCIVSSLGHNVETPSRNRTILVGLVRDLGNTLATRFEVRSPNPLTNTYLALAAFYQAMLDGINAVCESGKTASELEAEISKLPDEEGFYLEKGRAYRSEEDVFEHYTPEERNRIFGVHPATVYENISNLKEYPGKLDVLLKGEVMDEKLVKSFSTAVTNRWVAEILNRLMPENMDTVRRCKAVHNTQNAHDLDITYWAQVDQLRHYLMKDTYNSKSLFTRIREAAKEKDYELLSQLQQEMAVKISELKEIYSDYKKNLIDI